MHNSSVSDRVPVRARYERHDFPVRAVVIAVAGQVWPLVALLSALLAASLIWFLRSGDRMPAEIAWWFLKIATAGLAASFALHESAHVLGLKHIGTVTHLTIQRTAWRISVVPHGTMTPRQVVGVAIAGPMSSVAVGFLLWITDLEPVLAWWYLSHGIFLLPPFGDGRSLYSGLRGHGMGSS